MTKIRDTKTNEIYKGSSADSIARRVWGRKCTVRHSRQVAGQAMVVKPVGSTGQDFTVVATVHVIEG